ncbi:hypothetical protein GCM10008111_26910 [Alishewanella tabrizica]|uniref:Uncharacterized protein n=1 Tax=Alishewanella tabrizica TaxID=671278 RepID=A0ABQ2WVH2_9ALTE|nr:hypothetical protein GCM10008111_26910 [Alishewanella tabrizica]
MISTAEKNKPARGGLVDSVSDPEGWFGICPRRFAKVVGIVRYLTPKVMRYLGSVSDPERLLPKVYDPEGSWFVI